MGGKDEFFINRILDKAEESMVKIKTNLMKKTSQKHPKLLVDHILEHEGANRNSLSKCLFMEQNNDHIWN